MRSLKVSARKLAFVGLPFYISRVNEAVADPAAG